ncbi:hypothetical protein H696_04297 [Fonticula alba]|uniref:CAP-Gly domain-containing protein n=1 Tax=Fonticula alba TaxID=691883 RepID=A0A058Z3L0_FONAL|nr:hypothetical protein H696_04297 [Fonticula alba]KCV68879.1 hypothetical protein H696_04297 [Fonticula alba]|eukprot:XP_009496450.1 hypothetical protein H696_04297 [Fonticula alba]
MDQPNVSVGDRVLVNDRRGIVRFAGPIDGLSGIWVGIELDGPVGKNDGTVKGKRYFTCAPNHGLFVRPTAVTPLDEPVSPGPGGAASPVAPASPVIAAPESVEAAATESTAVPEPAAGPVATAADATPAVGAAATAATTAAPPTGSLPLSVDATVPQRHYDDLVAKFRLLETRLVEERAKSKQAERLRHEAETAQQARQRLEAQVADLQAQVVSLRKQDSEERRQREEREEALLEMEEHAESLTMDKELAEERADQLQAEVDQLREQVEELTLDLEIVRGEHEEELAKLAAAGEGEVLSPAAQEQVAQLQLQNDRLKEALMLLRDRTTEEKAALAKRVRDLEKFERDMPELQAKYLALKAENADNESLVEQLKLQVDDGLAAESMVEELSEKVLDLEDHITDLQNSIQDLEDLRTLSDQLEDTYVENARALEQALQEQEALVARLAGQLSLEHGLRSDRDLTIDKFRGLVRDLQERILHLEATLGSQSAAAAGTAAAELAAELHRRAAAAAETALDGSVLGGDPSAGAGAGAGAGLDAVPALQRLLAAEQARVTQADVVLRARLLRGYLPGSWAGAVQQADLLVPEAYFLELARCVVRAGGKAAAVGRLADHLLPARPDSVLAALTRPLGPAPGESDAGRLAAGQELARLGLVVTARRPLRALERGLGLLQLALSVARPGASGRVVELFAPQLAPAGGDAAAAAAAAAAGPSAAAGPLASLGSLLPDLPAAERRLDALLQALARTLAQVEGAPRLLHDAVAAVALGEYATAAGRFGQALCQRLLAGASGLEEALLGADRRRVLAGLARTHAAAIDARADDLFVVLCQAAGHLAGAWAPEPAQVTEAGADAEEPDGSGAADAPADSASASAQALAQLLTTANRHNRAIQVLAKKLRKRFDCEPALQQLAAPGRLGESLFAGEPDATGIDDAQVLVELADLERVQQVEAQLEGLLAELEGLVPALGTGSAPAPAPAAVVERLTPLAQRLGATAEAMEAIVETLHGVDRDIGPSQPEEGPLAALGERFRLALESQEQGDALREQVASLQATIQQHEAAAAAAAGRLDEERARVALLAARTASAREEAEQAAQLAASLEESRRDAQMYSEALEALRAELDDMEMQNISLRKELSAAVRVGDTADAAPQTAAASAAEANPAHSRALVRDLYATVAALRSELARTRATSIESMVATLAPLPVRRGAPVAAPATDATASSSSHSASRAAVAPAASSALSYANAVLKDSMQFLVEHRVARLRPGPVDAADVLPRGVRTAGHAERLRLLRAKLLAARQTRALHSLATGHFDPTAEDAPLPGVAKAAAV